MTDDVGAGVRGQYLTRHHPTPNTTQSHPDNVTTEQLNYNLQNGNMLLRHYPTTSSHPDNVPPDTIPPLAGIFKPFIEV